MKYITYKSWDYVIILLDSEKMIELHKDGRTYIMRSTFNKYFQYYVIDSEIDKDKLNNKTYKKCLYNKLKKAFNEYAYNWI